MTCTTGTVTGLADQPATSLSVPPAVSKHDKTPRVDATHDFRSDHDRLFH
jgi:hypothetical protein